jgi:hypothetical protein
LDPSNNRSLFTNPLKFCMQFFGVPIVGQNFNFLTKLPNCQTAGHSYLNYVLTAWYAWCWVIAHIFHSIFILYFMDLKILPSIHTHKFGALPRRASWQGTHAMHFTYLSCLLISASTLVWLCAQAAPGPSPGAVPCPHPRPHNTSHAMPPAKPHHKANARQGCCCDSCRCLLCRRVCKEAYSSFLVL